MSDTLFDPDFNAKHKVSWQETYWSKYLNDAKAPIKAQVDSPESVQAAIDNMPVRGAQEERVFNFLLEWGPATDSQIADALGLAENSTRPRRVRLVEKGLVKKVGSTTHGRAKSLWGVVE